MGEYFDSELEELLRKKQAEMQKRLAEEQRRREAELREAQRQALLRRILTNRARERLNNVKLVRPDLARLVEDQIIALVQAGRLVPPVDEDVVKQLLEAAYEQTRYEPRIRIKRK